MLNVFLPFTNTFLRLLFFLAGLIPQLLQKSRTRPRSKGGVGGECQWHEPTLRRRDTSRREARQGRRGRVESGQAQLLGSSPTFVGW